MHTSSCPSNHCSTLISLSIQGRCDLEPKSSLAAPLSDVAELAPFKPSQCLVVTDLDLMTVKHRSAWLDNLYIRLRRSDRSSTPLLVTVAAPGELYLTNVTLQGDSVGPCQALAARSRVLMQGTPAAVTLLWPQVADVGLPWSFTSCSLNSYNVQGCCRSRQTHHHRHHCYQAPQPHSHRLHHLPRNC